MSRLGKFWRVANTERLATYLIALWKLVRHADTPRSAKLVALLVLAYVASPIDLIPDFIPVLGQLDDLILVPLGVALVVKLTPPGVWQARMREAETQAESLPNLRWGAVVVVGIWLVVMGLLAWWLVGAVVQGA